MSPPFDQDVCSKDSDRGREDAGASTGTSTHDGDCTLEGGYIDLREAPSGLVLEPATLPVFARALRGYSPAHVDTYVDEQRHRMALLRQRTMRAETALTRAGLSAGRDLPLAPPAPSAVHSPKALSPPGRTVTSQPSAPSRASVPVGLALDEAGEAVADRRADAPAAARAETDVAPAFARYGICSAASVALSEVLIFVAYAVLRLGSAPVCSLVVSAIVALPVAVVYRTWVWPAARAPGAYRPRRAKFGPARRQVSFWMLTAAGVALSVTSVAVIQNLPQFVHLSPVSRGLVVVCISFSVFGLAWLARLPLVGRWGGGGSVGDGSVAYAPAPSRSRFVADTSGPNR